MISNSDLKPCNNEKKLNSLTTYLKIDKKKLIKIKNYE